MINMIFDEIYKELEENGRICIPGQMMFKEVKTKKGSDEANHIECIKKKEELIHSSFFIFLYSKIIF